MKTQTSIKTFGEELAFLEQYADVVVLSDSSGKAQAVVSPQLQGRVLTSTADGAQGKSFGWINHELIASKKINEHLNAHGGEDRFWLGPEGGQYSIFFKKGVAFDLEHWFTPTAIDTEAFALSAKTGNSVLMTKDIRLVNYCGARFSLHVDRRIAVLEKAEAINALNLQPAESVRLVAHQSINKVTNTGGNTWTKESGMLSIWIIGMFQPSPATTVAIPFKAGPEGKLGRIVNDAYFGKVSADRLHVGQNAVFFKGDGQRRGKIGISPRRAKTALGSYDAASKVLTIVQYKKPENVLDYVNSMWETQKEPYRGDAVNSYNDGPAKPGAKPFGPFYELETSSPALALAPQKSAEHLHRTFHLQGEEKDLDPISRAGLGVSLDEIKKALK